MPLRFKHDFGTFVQKFNQILYKTLFGTLKRLKNSFNPFSEAFYPHLSHFFALINDFY
jgi:hypothetical protein